MCLPQSPGLDLLRQAVEKLRSETSERPPGSLAGAELVELHRLMESLRSVFSTQLRDLERSGAYAAQGALSAAAWLRSECRLSPNAAAEQVQVARSLPQLPETAAAFAAGEISFAHAAQLSRCAEEVGLERLREAQPLFLTAARQLDPLRLRLLTRHLRYCLDPDGAQAAAEELHQRRGLHLSQSLEGVFYLEGRLEAEGGSLLQKALEACSGPRTAEDRRSPSQRRADALVELCRQQLDGGQLPQVGGQKPHLSLRMELSSLQPGGPAGELENGQPLGGEALRRLTCDAALEPVLVNEAGEALGVGRSRRVVSGALRRALVARDGGCRFPGCDRPAGWTDAHHLVHWADGGETALANTLLLCRPHHRRVHEEGWRLVADGSVGSEPCRPSTAGSAILRLRSRFEATASTRG
jgi:hypothetical protein